MDKRELNTKSAKSFKTAAMLLSQGDGTPDGGGLGNVEGD
jgi:hypothetical protein